MDFGLATFILLLAIIGLWGLFKLRVISVEKANALRNFRRTIERTIDRGDEDQIAKMRGLASKHSPYAAEKFATIEQEVRRKIQQRVEQ